MRTLATFIALLLHLVIEVETINPTKDILLYPNTENSPSLFLINFSLDKALPANSYILVAMDWYTSTVRPFNCYLVNSSISTPCTNLASPTFSLTISTSSLSKFNSILSASKVVVVQITNSLLANTNYALQIHLYNVVPNIQKISPSMEMYTMSSNGLVYEENTNMGIVINSKPITNLMSVSILNTLSANYPGASSSLKAEITITQPISTSISTLIFTIQYPFSFSLGSIPSVTQSSSYATNPISLYSAPTISSYEVVSPNIFVLLFNEQFSAGRKFIVEINQINNPFIIASSNISIYSHNYNTLTPLEAFQNLYPIATTSYPLTLTMGLPYDAPYIGPMQYYQNTSHYVQISIQIPYSVPDGYVLRIQFTNTNIYAGTAYANFQSLNYTPIYNYAVATNVLVISGFGPIVIGTTVVVNLMIAFYTANLFAIKAYIDTAAAITSFSASKYVFQGLQEASGGVQSSFFWNYYDSQFGWSWRTRSSSTMISGQWFYIHIYQNIHISATSSGSYITFYLPPIVQVATNFDINNDCRISWNTNSCSITFYRTSNYLQVTIQGNAAYLASTPNIFPYQTSTYIYLTNMYWPLASSTKTIYQIYMSLYASNVVNPVVYNAVNVVSADPAQGALSGLALNYLSNYYTATSSAYQTYPGVLRFSSTTPSQLNLVVQQNQKLVITFYARYGFRSITTLKNMDPYPCTSNIAISCQYLQGFTGNNQLIWFDKVVVTFANTDYSTKNFHILIPDMQIAQYENYFWYHVGYYNLLTKDYNYDYSGRYYRTWTSWDSSIPNDSTFYADITGKAGSYRNNVSIYVSNPSINTGANSFIILCTNWSLFENGVTTLSNTTLAMTTPATFTGLNDQAPLAVYVTSGMYLTVIPFTYVTTQSTFTFTLDKAHMPYSYDLPNYYIYSIRNTDWFFTSSNALVMSGSGILYQSPLQSLVVSCQDNALGVVNTYCTIVFGTSNPLLLNGYIRLSLDGMTVATNMCYLSLSNSTSIPVTCVSSSDNKNVTVAMSGWEFYPAGTFTLVVYGMGISSSSLSQSVTLYLYDSSLQFIIETGVRIITTTIAGLSYISLTEIMYSYLNPLSYNTMSIIFYLPRPLYQDEQFAFVIGQDLSDVNTEVLRLNIKITRQDGVVLYPLYSLDNVNYLIVFSFSDPSQLIAGNYTMTISGLCTPASQSNGAFNMIYRRTYDFTYSVTNNFANVIFPTFQNLVISNISMASYFNTEGYKQDIIFTITNTNVNVDSKVVWIVNFPSYYSPQLFQNDAYCLVNGALALCQVDPNTPYQLAITNSAATVMAGTAYTVSVIGLGAPRGIYTNNAYAQRYIFIGVLQNSSSTAYSQRSLLAPYQTIQSTVTGIINVQNMIGVSSSNLFSFSSIYAQFQMVCNVAITSGSYLFIDLPIQFNNLNNVPLNAILIFGANTISTNAAVTNRKIQINITTTISANTVFQVQLPNLPTPLTPCTTEMSTMIVTVTPSSKLSITAASSLQGNSAPKLTFVANNLYISFNNNTPITITAGTYSQPIPITTSSGAKFLSNINIQLQSTGFTFTPSTVFLPIGQKSASFVIGADKSLLPITYFYQAIKQEEVITNYQITLNMNIQVTNTPALITLPTSLDLPLGGCTKPFIISLNNPPFTDVTISFSFNNTLYSQTNLYPNPILTPSLLTFTTKNYNNTFSFCSSNALPVTTIPLAFQLSGSNFDSYAFSPSNQIMLNVVNNVANTTPTLNLVLNNQQKTFLDINFTNNVDGVIFYEMMVGSSKTPNSLQNLQVYLKSNTWILASPSDFMNHIYTNYRDDRISQFFQLASTSTVRIKNLIPEYPYTLCAYLINLFGVVGDMKCLNLVTMTWGTVIKAQLSFTSALNSQQLNNIICYFTKVIDTNQLNLIDSEGNSCDNRSVTNKYYKYPGVSFTTQNLGTNIYLFTDATLTGTDPAPAAFTNLFGPSGNLTSVALSGAQSLFAITYMSANYVTSLSARLLASPSIPDTLAAYFTTPSYNYLTTTLTVKNVQIVGGVGSIYFVLVLYKQISVNSITNETTVNVRINKPPTRQQVLNCQNWLGQTAEGCARAIYTGVSPLTVSLNSVQPNSLYMLYYVMVSQFPMYPIASSSVSSTTIVTYLCGIWKFYMLLFMLMLMML